MMEKEKRLHRVCFSGHRPEKLIRCEYEIKRDLEKQIMYETGQNRNVFISGMARGVDIWAAEIVLALKSKNDNIKLICACPYIDFEKNWSKVWQKRYSNILDNADYIRYISPKYSASCFQVRNEWMVNHSSKLIAVFNGALGGTKNTVKYAMRMNVPISYIKA